MANVNEPSPATPPAYTSGPWTISVSTWLHRYMDGTRKERYGAQVRAVSGRCVAVVQGKTQEEVQANARLVAAAPDLLEACELLFHSLGNWVEIADEQDRREYDREAMRKGEAAIARANGNPA